MRRTGGRGRGLRRLASALVVASAWLGAAQARAQSPMFFLDSEIDVSTAVYTLNQSTGQLLPLGSIDIMLGEATGLAAADANVLYVTTLLGNVIRVDLMPSYMATTLGNVGGKLTQLQFDAGLLYAVDEDTDELSSIQISPLLKTVIGTIHIGNTMGPVLDIIGGDLSRDSLGNWFLFTNAMVSTSAKLYSLDITTAVATEIGPMMWVDGRITGLAFDYGDSDKLYASARDTDQLLTLDPTTGMVTNSVDICESCPTVFDVRAGDLGVPFGTATATVTATPTTTPTLTGTATETPSLSPSTTQTSTSTATSTNPPPPPTQTRTASSTGTATATASGTVTATPTSTPLRDNGDPCSSPSQCQSMNCVDGVCCDTPCDGPDETCNLPGREGTCVPITTAPAPTLSWPAVGVSVGGLILIAAAHLLRRRRSR
jgi:hypothetical protein